MSQPTDAPKFTREELEHWRDWSQRDPEQYLAAYALTLLDEKEQAERERDEAYEAMLNLDPAVIRRARERKEG